MSSPDRHQVDARTLPAETAQPPEPEARDAGQTAPAGEAMEPASERPAAAEAPRIRYLHAYSQIFGPLQQGVQNVLLLTVCQFIPFIGILLLWGFAYEGVEALHRRPRWPQPDFDFNRFSEYLQRGLAPGILVIVFWMIWPFFLFLLEMVAFALVFLFISLVPQPYLGITVSIVAPILVIAVLLMVLLLTMLLRPVLLRGGLSQDIGQMFRLGWSKDFVARVWPELMLVTLFGYVTFFPLIALGFLALFFGVFPAQIISFLAGAHLDYQLYQLYLARGGEPVPLRPPPPRFAHLWNDAPR